MNQQLKKLLGGILAVVLIAGGAIWMIKNPGPEHIEDTNGADNYALQQIAPEDIVACNMGMRGGMGSSETTFAGFSSGTEYSCKKFTGVCELYSTTVFAGSDIYLSLADFRIKSGNFAFYVVLDDNTMWEVKPDEWGMAEFFMEDISQTCTVRYIIAGESANFSFVAPTDW